MCHFSKIVLLILSASLVACSHPLESEGKGDIVSSSGTRDCLQDQMPCENLIVGDYSEVYHGVPAEGYVFVGWLRCEDEIQLSCVYSVPANVVRKAWGKVLPSLVALFRPVKLLLTSTAEGGVVSQSASADCSGEQTCVVDGGVGNGFDDVFTAAPAEGFRFFGWESGLSDCDDSTYPCAVTSERMHAKAQSDVYDEYGHGGVDTARERIVELTPRFVPLTPGGFALGAERVIDSLPESEKSNGDVAALSGGGYVVAWTSKLANSGDAIYAQRFDGDGTAVGDTILVSEDTFAFRSRTNVLALGSDRFLVSWEFRPPVVPQTVDIFARVYEASGVPVTGVIRIETSESGIDFVNPLNVLKPDGGFLIAWDKIDNRFFGGSYAQHFDASGQPVGTPVSITGSDDTNRQIAYFSDGGYIVATSHEAGGNSDVPITVRCLSPEGELLQQRVAGDPYSGVESLAVLKDESFLITWNALDLDDQNSVGVRTSSAGVFARRFSKNCTPQGEAILVNSTISGTQYNSTSTATDDGGFAVAWIDLSTNGVFVQRFDAQGERLGGETVVNTVVASKFYRSGVRLAALNNGAMAAIWNTDEIREFNFIFDVVGKLLFNDSDGDLMSDKWELAYGLDSLFPYDALIDTDGDGVHNLDEFDSGSNPNIDEE